MTLGDDAIDLYSRHVLLPEIGPRGQERLLATRVTIDGPPSLRAPLADLLGRSGLQIVGEDGHLAVALGHAFLPRANVPCIVGWSSETTLHATTLSGRPCPVCWKPEVESSPSDPHDEQALVALIATVVTLRAVSGPSGSSDVELRLDPPGLATRSYDVPGCAHCPPGAPGSA